MRKVNMDNEEEIARLRYEIAKLNERMRSFAVEMETKDHELMNINELVNRRKQEVLNTQQDNDKLVTMLRNVTDMKDTVDAQKLMTEEKYMVCERLFRKWIERSSSFVMKGRDTKLNLKKVKFCSNMPIKN